MTRESSTNTVLCFFCWAASRDVLIRARVRYVQERLKRYHDHPEAGISMEEMAQKHGL